MDIATPSRFACLKIEEEERPSSNIPKRKTEEKIVVDNSKTSQSKKINGNTHGGKKAINSGQKQVNNSKKSKSKKGHETKQWEEWKKRDDELVDNNFEQQLQSAILQSKMEFEKQKKSAKTEADSQGKKKKAKTMSLDQFLEKDKENEKQGSESPLRTENGRDFFKEVMQSAKEEIKREKVEEERKKRTEKFEEIVSLTQCQERLEEERAKNALLEEELGKARKEIALVKKRNTTLCSMLSQGEMKDKAAVLLELERLTSVKEELMEEVSRLHELLEQERSGKVHYTSDKVEKNDRSDSSSKQNKDKNKK